MVTTQHVQLRWQPTLLAAIIFWLLSVVVAVPAFASIDAGPEAQEAFEGEVGWELPTLAPTVNRRDCSAAPTANRRDCFAAPTANRRDCSAAPKAGAPEVYYRAMSRAEYEGLLKNKGLSPRGESFVTQDLEYARQIKARHPELYDTIVRFETQPGTTEALVQHGARGPGRLLEQRGLGDLPRVRKGQTDVVHVKAEGTSINYGLRKESVQHFNQRVLKVEELE
jgi:hypothetical protein